MTDTKGHRHVIAGDVSRSHGGWVVLRMAELSSVPKQREPRPDLHYSTAVLKDCCVRCINVAVITAAAAVRHGAMVV